MSLLKNVRILCDELLNLYTISEGVSSDAYHAHRLFHPMAEAKFISANCCLLRSELINERIFSQRITYSIARLRNSAVFAFSDKRNAWGLGFEWIERSAAEPYLITTALVHKALNDVLACNIESNDVLLLSKEVLQGLVDWCEQHSACVSPAVRIPYYSKTMLQPVYNSAIYACSSMRCATSVPESLVTALDSTIHHITSEQKKGLGWTYSESNNIVDLVHQCYIMNSLLSLGVDTEEFAHDLISQFWAGDDFVDALKFEENISIARAQSTRFIVVRRMHDKQGVEVLKKMSRLWSLGELLVLLSRIASISGVQSSFGCMASTVAEMLIKRFNEAREECAFFHRHTMHVAHGLANYLLFRRA